MNLEADTIDRLLYISGAEIAALGVNPSTLRSALGRAFRVHAEGRAQVPPKLTVGIGLGHFFQSLCAASPPFAATKWVGIAGDNPARGLANVNGLVILSDFATGVPLAILDGNSLTVLRTAAMSALAALISRAGTASRSASSAAASKRTVTSPRFPRFCPACAELCASRAVSLPLNARRLRHALSASKPVSSMLPTRRSPATWS